MIDDHFNLHHKLALALLAAASHYNSHLLMVNHFLPLLEHAGNDDQALPTIPLVYGSMKQKPQDLKSSKCQIAAEAIP